MNKRIAKEKKQQARIEGLADTEKAVIASPDQRAYWKHLKGAMTGTGDIVEAVTTYQSPMKNREVKKKAKRPAESALCTPTPKRRKGKYAAGEKEIQEPEPVKS